MRVEIILDLTNRRDATLRDEITGWLHYTSRNLWTVRETEADDGDDEGRTLLTYAFHDPLDADDLYRRLAPRARRM
jgi:hypothetical protein